MSEYKITVDSTCDLSYAYLKENNVSFISLKYILDGTEYADDLFQNMDANEFYTKLKNGSTATTSQVNVTDYTEFWEPMLNDGMDILHLSFSSGISGSCNSAHIAASDLTEKYPDRKIIVVDSLAACMGFGLLVSYAIDMKRDGKTIEEVQSWLEENKLHMRHMFTVDSLAHLRRGGRVSGTAAALGTLMQIKPMLYFNAEGKIKSGDKVKGRKKSLIALVNKMDEFGVDLDGQRIYISHAACPDDADFVAKKVRERHPGVSEITIGYVGPVIGAHSGPGTVALFFMGKSRAGE